MNVLDSTLSIMRLDRRVPSVLVCHIVSPSAAFSAVNLCLQLRHRMSVLHHNNLHHKAFHTTPVDSALRNLLR